MNFKIAFFLLFIGASSASFLEGINHHVSVKNHLQSPFKRLLPDPAKNVPKTKSGSKDVLDDLIAILGKIFYEIELYGEIVTISLLDDLKYLLIDIQVLGDEYLEQAMSIIESNFNQLPQEVIDILNELGLVPSKSRLENMVRTLTKSFEAKDIWQDFVDAAMTQLIQILADLDSLGIEISDETLATIEELILIIMAEGGHTWDVLLQLLEEYSFELNEILGELLGELGIIGKAKAPRNIIDDVIATITQILGEWAIFGEVSEVLLETLSDLLNEIQTIGGDTLQQFLDFIASIQNLLPQFLIDILVDLGFIDPSKIHHAAPENIVALFRNAPVESRDIWQDFVDAAMTQLIQILADLDSWGIEISDETLATIEELILIIMAEGGHTWDVLLQLLEEYSFELNEILGELLGELGIIGKARAPKNIIDDLIATITQILEEWTIFGEVSDALIQTLTDLLNQIQTIGGDTLQQVLDFFNSIESILPQFIIDILVDLGFIDPSKSAHIRPTTIAGLFKKSFEVRDIWQDFVDAAMTQLIQILADLDSWGIEISDETLATIEELILIIMAEGGHTWDVLLQLLEEYSFELNEILGELLGELGIIGKAKAAETKALMLVKMIKKHLDSKDVWQDFIDALLLQLVEILANLEEWEIEITDAILAAIEDLILSIMAGGGQTWDTLLELLEQYSDQLGDIIGDLLDQLGIGGSDTTTPAV